LNEAEADGSRWQRTSPLAAVFYLGKIYQALARNALQSLAPLAAFLVAVKGDTVTKLAIAIGVVVVATVTHALLRYWFFRYRVLDHSILIREGVFNKKQLDIKFERIQGIITTQNVVFRLFGLVTVSFDTAGSSRSEGFLPAIAVELAEALKDRIRPGGAAPGSVASEVTTEPAADRRVLLRLTSGDLVRTGLSSGRVFLVLAVIGPLGEYIDDETRRWVAESAVLQWLGATHLSFSAGFVWAALIVPGILLLLMAASIAGAFLRYHGYILTADGEVLRSTGGLLTRHEQAVNRTKIQSLQVIQNLMLLAFRRSRLRAKQATSGTTRTGSRFEIPLCTRDALSEIAFEMLRDEGDGLPLDPADTSFVPISRYYLRSRVVLYGVAPAVAAIALSWVALGTAALLALLWIPLVATVAWRKYRRYGMALTARGMAVRRGLLGYRIVLWMHRKVQRITVTQSPLQRRRQLATIRIYLAAGSVRIPFVDYRSAKQLRDYVLYCTESSELAWH
jgi:putative membrane protein